MDKCTSGHVEKKVKKVKNFQKLIFWKKKKKNQKKGPNFFKEKKLKTVKNVLKVFFKSSKSFSKIYKKKGQQSFLKKSKIQKQFLKGFKKVF